MQSGFVGKNHKGSKNKIPLLLHGLRRKEGKQMDSGSAVKDGKQMLYKWAIVHSLVLVALIQHEFRTISIL